MNLSTGPISIKICSSLSENFLMAVAFPSPVFLLAHIAACVVNGIFLFTEILLNSATVIAYWKSPRLKTKVSYFLIMLLSLVELSVSLVSSLSFTVHLANEVAGTGWCLPGSIARKGALSLGFSITVLSAINFERYIGIVHPLFHRAKVTKKKCFTYMIFMWFLWSAMYGISFLEDGILVFKLFLIANIVIILTSTVFIYVSIYRKYTLSARSLNRTRFSEGQGNNIQESQTQRSNTSDVHQYKSSQGLAKDMKLTRSCLAVVFCFFISFLPLLVLRIMDVKEPRDAHVFFLFRTWGLTFYSMDATINSVLFFWGNQLLRDEARRVLKQGLC